MKQSNCCLIMERYMNTRNNEGTTALIIATKNKQQETIKLLLDRGADVNIQNNEGTSALMDSNCQSERRNG